MSIFNNIGSTELILIVVIVLLLFGRKKLPELGRGVGEVIHEFKKAISGKKDQQ